MILEKIEEDNFDLLCLREAYWCYKMGTNQDGGWNITNQQYRLDKCVDLHRGGTPYMFCQEWFHEMEKMEKQIRELKMGRTHRGYESS